MKNHNDKFPNNTIGRVASILVFTISFLILIEIIMNYYMAIPKMGGWFANDDFIFLKQFENQLAPELNNNAGIVQLLSNNFFRPVTRNLFWWSIENICGKRYECFYSYNLAFLLLGTLISVLMVVLATIKLNAIKINGCHQIDLYFIIASVLLSLVSIILLSTSSISLASWISNSQSTVSFFIFSLTFLTLILAIKKVIIHSVFYYIAMFLLITLLAFSNIGYFIPSVIGSLILILIFCKPIYLRNIIIISIILEFLVIIYGYKEIILAKIKPGAPYETSLDIGTVKTNLSYYFDVDNSSFIVFLVGFILIILVVVSGILRKNKEKVDFFSSIQSIRFELKLFFILWFMSLVSLVPYMPQILQRYQYYLFLFRTLNILSLVPLVYFFINQPLCFYKTGIAIDNKSNQLKPMFVFALSLIILSGIKWHSEDSNSLFNYYIREPNGNITIKLLNEIYSLDKTIHNLCLIPDESIRREKTHPYYPDDFWWRLGFGSASAVYSESFNKSYINLSYASYKNDCAAQPIAVVDANYLVKLNR